MLLDEAVQAGIDVEFPVVVRQTNKKGDIISASDFTAAEFSLYTDDRILVLTKSLDDGIVVEDVDGDSLFIITLADADTLQLSGLYGLDMVVTDGSGIVSMPLHNEITFKPRLGV
jgi:hypothetical protein